MTKKFVKFLKIFVKRRIHPSACINGSINQSINWPINRPINQSINQSINQLTNQSTNQSVDQSVDQSINQSIEGSHIKHAAARIRHLHIRTRRVNRDTAIITYGDNAEESSVGISVFTAVLLAVEFMTVFFFRGNAWSHSPFSRWLSLTASLSQPVLYDKTKFKQQERKYL